MAARDRAPPVRIRPATTEECAEVARLEQRLFGEHGFDRSQIAYYRSRERAFVLVAARSRQVVGYLVGAVDRRGRDPVLWIITLAVLPSWRREGIGGRLTRAAVREGQRMGAARARLQVGKRNRGAIRLYRSHGFETSGVLSNYYGRNRDAVLMVREVAEE